jgi:hypothetical protein
MESLTKIKRRKIFVIYFILMFHLVNGQSSYMPIPQDYFHKAIIDSLSTNINLKSCTYLIYQSIVFNFDSTGYASFVIVKKKKKVCVYLINQNNVFGPFLLNHSNIFNYRHFQKTPATIDEGSLGFIPPLTSILNNKIILFFSQKYQFYYELGDPITYEADEEKEKYRHEWIKIIDKEMTALIQKQVKK